MVTLITAQIVIPILKLFGTLGGSAPSVSSMWLKISCIWIPFVFVFLSLGNLMDVLMHHGVSMQCHDASAALTASELTTRCESFSLYAVTSAFEDGQYKNYPGIATHSGEELKYYSAYLHLYLLLLVSALISYLPELLRKNSKGEKWMKAVADVPSVYAKKRETGEPVIAYLEEMANDLYGKLDLFRSYVLRCALCEFLCVPIALFQFWFIDWYLGGDFLWFGFKTALRTFSPENPLAPSYDPVMRLFPRLVKCEILSHPVVKSPMSDELDVACELPINKTNGVLYLIVWFCLAIQLVLFVCVLLYRVIYLLAFAYLQPFGKGHLLEAHSGVLKFKRLNASDLSWICRKSFLDLPVFLMIADLIEVPEILNKLFDGIKECSDTEKEAKILRAKLEKLDMQINMQKQGLNEIKVNN